MSFKVTILGSGAALPTPKRNSTAQFLECRGRKILIDCGEATQIQLRKYKVKFQKIDLIVISHLHGDHYFGLVGLLSSMHLLGRKKSIQVFGPLELKNIIESQLNYGGSKLAFDVEFFALDMKKSGVLYEDDKITVTHFPIAHKVPTNGFLIQEKERERTLMVNKCERDNIRIEHYQFLKKGKNVLGENGEEISFKKYTLTPDSPKSYAFCSDTKYTESILPYLEKVTVLYHEATFTQDMEDRAKATMHSTAGQAAKIAKLANVGRLLMGHLSARYDSGKQHDLEAQEIFKASSVVEDGDVIEIK